MKKCEGDRHEANKSKWIYTEDETGQDGYVCAECGFFEPWYYEYNEDIEFITKYRFCPGCGRKM